MNVTAHPDHTGLVEDVAQRGFWLLQPEVLLEISGPEYANVMDDVVFVGKDDLIALRNRYGRLAQHQTVLTNCNRRRGLGRDDRAH